MNNWSAKYRLMFILGMGGFAVLLGVGMGVNDQAASSTALKWVVSFLPLLPLSLAVYAAFLQINLLDEMQRKIQLNALLTAIMITGAVAATVGMLEANELIPHTPVIWVPLLTVTLWGIASRLISNSYQ